MLILKGKSNKGDAKKVMVNPEQFVYLKTVYTDEEVRVYMFYFNEMYILLRQKVRGPQQHKFVNDLFDAIEKAREEKVEFEAKDLIIDD